jgi:hypothetical protein
MRHETPITPPHPVLAEPGLAWHRPDGSLVQFAIKIDQAVTIGSDPSNAVVFDSPFVSKTHAIIRYSEGQYIIEDQKSANGTRVNGAPVAVLNLQPGDLIEIGDRRIEFGELSRKPQAGTPGGQPVARAGAGKMIRLAAVAVIAGAIMIGLLSMIAPKPPAPEEPLPQARLLERPAGSVNLPIATDSPVVRESLARAQSVSTALGDVLYDDAIVQYRAGRLREAAQLLAALVARQPLHPLGKPKFEQVKVELDAAIEGQRAEGERAFAQLRYDDAVHAWEQVLNLADPSDPRYPAAQALIQKAQAARGR